jgi:hypothetical protein
LPERTVTRTVTVERTVRTKPAPKPTRGHRQVVEEVVNELVAASEQGDGRRVCALTGQPPGSGLPAFRRCAAAVGYRPATLPSSDEFSIERVRIRGRRATVAVVGGVRFTLERSGSRWIVVRVALP